MRIYELSPRLREVADQVRPGCRLADVGTDHAYLPVWLLLQGVVEYAVASDLRQGPLERARENALRYGVLDRLSLRLCDGLSGISPEEADTVVIAGMGGETIAAILSRAFWTREEGRQLLLQPMTAQEELRRWLMEHGYRIEEETLVREGGSLYLTLRAAGGEMEKLTPAELWAGRQERGMEAPLRGLYLEKLLRRARLAAQGARRSGKPEDALRAKELADAAAGLEKMKEEWEAWQR